MQSAQPDNDKDVAYFSRRARQDENSEILRLFSSPIWSKVLDLTGSLPESSTILDVGCGTGHLLRAAALRWPGARLIGVDPAAGAIEVARERNPKAAFYVAAADAIPLPDSSVAVAFSTLSFHHWADKPKGLRELARVLQPGGRFIFADLVWPVWIRWLVQGLGHSSPAPATLQAMFKLVGLPVQDLSRILLGFVVVTTSIKTGSATGAESGK